MKMLKCRDAGFDCNHEIRAHTEEEIITKAADHAKNVHGLEKVDKETVKMLKSIIREEKVPT